MKCIVVSAVNLFSAGPLAIGREFLRALIASPRVQNGEFTVVFFCHRAAIYQDLLTNGRVRLIEKPLSRRNWLFRLFYEYAYFSWWSRQRQIHAWVSLHDVTPNVTAGTRVVYCHNPAPFYRGPWRWGTDPRFQLFRLFYRYVYRINLKKNRYVIVQQQWIREIFVREYGCSPERVIVAAPTGATETPVTSSRARRPGDPATVIYPAFPRSFKNFEVLLNAMRRVRDVPLQLILTMDGSENRYAAALRNRYRDLTTVTWAGFLTAQRLKELYSSVDALVFPSKLETWGLPLSEFRSFRKPVYAANLPYAKETLSGYQSACFFNPDDPDTLSDLLRRFVVSADFQPTPVSVDVKPPRADTWHDLLRMLDLA